MKQASFLVLLFFLLFPQKAIAADVAICGESTGYAYDANRKMNKEEGWNKDKIPNGKFTFTISNKGDLDLLISGEFGVSSSVAEGAQIIPATISEDAATIVLIYPNKLTETYVFQKLSNGKFQVMWTQAKAETPFPRITAFVADCSYLDLSRL